MTDTAPGKRPLLMKIGRCQSMRGDGCAAITTSLPLLQQYYIIIFYNNP